MRSDRLFSRDFTLMVAGQIISLFGNAILRFALSLYVLDTTGSAAAVPRSSARFSFQPVCISIHSPTWFR